MFRCRIASPTGFFNLARENVLRAAQKKIFERYAKRYAVD